MNVECFRCEGTGKHNCNRCGGTGELNQWKNYIINHAAEQLCQEIMGIEEDYVRVQQIMNEVLEVALHEHYLRSRK